MTQAGSYGRGAQMGLQGLGRLVAMAGFAAGLGLWGPEAGVVRADSVAAPELPAPKAGQPAAAELVAALHLPDLAAVVQAEGGEYGDQLRQEMFPDRGGADWPAVVARIYDPKRLTNELTRVLDRELADRPEVLRAAQGFFTAPAGKKIVALEIEARRALMDDAAEQAAKEAFAEMEARSPARLDALRRFVEVNDLVEMNVMGALNANLAFYKGMASGGAFTDEMSEEDMLGEVWSQEDQVRSDTEDWLWPYLALAYQPLSDEEMQAYQAFSETPEGRALNAALFAAFDASFVRISGELGRAVSRMVQGEDI